MNELEKIREEKGGAAAMLIVWVAIFAALSMTGCAGIGFKAEAYRIDQRQEQVSTIDKPFKCLFVECGGK